MGLGKGEMRGHSGNERGHLGQEGLCHIAESGLYSAKEPS